MVVLSGLGSVYGLRNNNLRMVELREAVLTADEQGEGQQQLDEKLKELANFVTTHMNTDLSRGRELAIDGEAPVQLAYKYYYDSILNIATYVKSSQANLSLLGEARIACEVSSVPISERLQCVNQELANLSHDKFPQVEPLSKDFYVYDFASPVWSPDLAGFSLIIFGLTIILLLLRFIVGAIIARRVKNN